MLQLVWSDRVSNIKSSMVEIWANFSGGHYLEEEMAMAWSHLAEAFLYHPRQALTWNNHHGRQKRSHPQNTWRHLLEAEIKSIGKSWYQLKRDAQVRRLRIEELPRSEG